MKLHFCYLETLRFPEIKTWKTTEMLRWVIRDTNVKKHDSAWKCTVIVKEIHSSLTIQCIISFRLSCCKANSISCFPFFVGLLILVSVYLHSFHTLNDSTVWTIPVQNICSFLGLIFTTLYIKHVVSGCKSTTQQQHTMWSQHCHNHHHRHFNHPHSYHPLLPSLPLLTSGM